MMKSLACWPILLRGPPRLGLPISGYAALELLKGDSKMNMKQLCAATDRISWWGEINFRMAEKQVKKLQRRIAAAYRNDEMGKVASLQERLIHSFSAKALAVKIVSSNRGKNTAGVDGIVWKTDSQKLRAVYSLRRRGYRPRPLRRIYIRKPGGGARPLSIPTMKDRAMLTLYKFALEPIAELSGDPGSYGFRHDRSAEKAALRLMDECAHDDEFVWVLKADIHSCFDSIAHKWLLSHIPMDKQMLSRFLSCGYMPRIISDELFNKVADRMSANKKAPARARAKVEYLLTTKLFCGRCKEMMTGFSATGKQGKVYNYYICNGRKAKKCEKGMVKKDYIEDIVVAQCRKFLTPANIAKIAQKVSALCEEDRDTSNLRFLKKDLADNKKKQENALNAVMETDNPTIRKGLYDRIAQLEAAQKEIEAAIAQEVIPFPSLTEPKIRFFLTALRDGSVKDIKYRKMLIRLFVNRIYLYDDHLTTTFNTGEDTVEINDRLLAELEENSDKERLLFKGKDGPPNTAFKLDA